MRFIISFFLVFTGLSMFSALAQQSRFLFLQTENQQPFNVTLNKKIYSSTATGYLIVPKLSDGTYAITVGFAGNNIPDQSFAIEIGQKDVGYNIKNFGDKGWGLFNLQSFEVIMSGEPLKKAPENTASVTPVIKEEKSVVKRFEPEGVPVKPKEEPAPVTASRTSQPSEAQSKNSTKSPSEPLQGAINKQDQPTMAAPASSKQVAVSNAEVEEKPVVQNEVISPSGSMIERPAAATTVSRQVENSNRPMQKAAVSRISQIQGAEAFYITYTDGADTIQVLVPNVQVAGSNNSGSSNEGSKPKSDLRFLEIETRQAPAVNGQVQATVKTNDNPATQLTTSTKQCSTVASNQDFLTLRKTMAAGNTDEDMMNEAKKTFKVICFTTTQVKNLSYLFLTDQARYQFFDLAYPHVSDPKEFANLASELTDTYYLNRFKAMLVN